MDLSVIILNYKSKGLLKNCLRSIFSVPLRIKHEVIVVDNDSGDGSLQMVANHFPQAKTINSSSNLGHAGGNNLGIKQAQGRYILILNPDIVVLDNALEKMVEFMDQNPGVGAASCRLINPDGTVQMNCRKFPEKFTPIFSRTVLGNLPFARKAMRDYLMVQADHEKTQAVDWLLAACLIVRKKAIDQIGLLDDRFFLYFADVDWCRQLWKAGWSVHYYAGAELVHYYHRESASQNGISSVFFNKTTRIHIWDWFKYLRKNRNQGQSIFAPHVEKAPSQKPGNN